MKDLLLSCLLILSVASPAGASDPKITAEFALATGYMLCPPSKTPPPLETAFICSGMQTELDNISVEMTSQPVSRPGWVLYSGTYQGKINLNAKEVSYELLVALASGDGKKYAFIDGRLIDKDGGPPAYFRVAADNGFDELSYVTAFSHPTEYDINGYKSEFKAQLSIAKKVVSARPPELRDLRR